MIPVPGLENAKNKVSYEKKKNESSFFDEGLNTILRVITL